VFFIYSHMDLKEKILRLIGISYIDFIIGFLGGLFIFIFYWKNTLINYTIMFISVFGFCISITGRNQIGSSFDMLAKAKKLINTGIYSKLRHPIYYGGLLFVFGLIIFTIGESINIYLIIIFVLLLIYQVIRIIFEEKVLEKKFGKKYLEYRKSTWF
jgi:protein-S-isoprenylcysteine O-methyltransferase Ste14